MQGKTWIAPHRARGGTGRRVGGRRTGARADRAQVQPHRPARRPAPEGGRAVRADASSSTRRAATRCRSIRRASSPTIPRRVEQLQLGGIDFTVTGTGTYATHIPTLNLTVLPYLVETYEQGWKLYDDSKWLQGAVRQGAGEGLPVPVDVRGRLPLDDDQGSAQLAGRRQGQEAAHLPQRDDALAARGDGLQHPDHAAAGGLPRDPAGHGAAGRRIRSTRSTPTSSTRSRRT